jgi:hypothetical protein
MHWKTSTADDEPHLERDPMKTTKLVAMRLGMAAAAIVAASLVTGCSHVAPYERGTLAHPTMSPDDMSSGVDEHVRAVSEGATGGFGGGGGGCGCN